MEGFIGIIFCLLLWVVMGYIIYQHFSSPFKAMKQVKIQKEYNQLIKEKFKNIVNDPVFQERIKPVEKALEENKITSERFMQIFTELLRERNYELFGNKDSGNSMEQVNQ